MLPLPTGAPVTSIHLCGNQLRAENSWRRRVPIDGYLIGEHCKDVAEDVARCVKEVRRQWSRVVHATFRALSSGRGATFASCGYWQSPAWSGPSNHLRDYDSCPSVLVFFAGSRSVEGMASSTFWAWRSISLVKVCCDAPKTNAYAIS